MNTRQLRKLKHLARRQGLKLVPVGPSPTSDPSDATGFHRSPAGEKAGNGKKWRSLIKIVGSTFGVLSMVFGLVSFYWQLRADIAFETYDATDKRDPFSTPFKITNNSQYAIYGV